MLLRATGAVALALWLSSAVTSNAFAGSQPGFVHRVSCSVVRYYVEKYSASMAEAWARSHGATEAQIDAARRCLREQPSQSVQATRWNAW
jgi:hypothetical protein